MRLKWFNQWGWFYVPASVMGAAISLVTIAFCVSVFLAIDHKSHHGFSSSSPVVMWDSKTLETIKTIETYAGFAKASGSVIGPDEPILLPWADRRPTRSGLNFSCWHSCRWCRYSSNPCSLSPFPWTHCSSRAWSCCPAERRVRSCPVQTLIRT